MPFQDLVERITAISYRIAIYLSNSIIDDAAMLSILFC